MSEDEFCEYCNKVVLECSTVWPAVEFIHVISSMLLFGHSRVGIVYFFFFLQDSLNRDGLCCFTIEQKKGWENITLELKSKIGIDKAMIDF